MLLHRCGLLSAMPDHRKDRSDRFLLDLLNPTHSQHKSRVTGRSSLLYIMR